MSKDYKGPAKKPAGSKGGAGSLLIGILIGLLLGLGIALAVAWYINKMPTPFVNRAVPPPKSEPLKSAELAQNRRQKRPKRRTASRDSIFTRYCRVRKNR